MEILSDGSGRRFKITRVRSIYRGVLWESVGLGLRRTQNQFDFLKVWFSFFELSVLYCICNPIHNIVIISASIAPSNLTTIEGRRKITKTALSPERKQLLIWNKKTENSFFLNHEKSTNIFDKWVEIFLINVSWLCDSLEGNKSCNFPKIWWSQFMLLVVRNSSSVGSDPYNWHTLFEIFLLPQKITNLKWIHFHIISTHPKTG